MGTMYTLPGIAVIRSLQLEALEWGWEAHLRAASHARQMSGLWSCRDQPRR